jgi:hypothetical protein
MRPRPVVDRLAQPGLDGVSDDIAAGGIEVPLVLDRARGEAVREEVSEAAVTLVESLRVATLQALESA